MKLNRFGRLIGLAVGGSLVWFGAAQAQSVEEFYKGKTITVVAPANPGGGADLTARTFAPYLAKHIPGSPDVVVQNLPGAGGMKAAIQLMTKDPKDGTVIALLQRNNLYVPLVSAQPVAFDARKVHWLGSLAKDTYLLSARSDAPVNKAEDLFTTTLRTSATSFSNENRTLPVLMNEYFGTKFDVVAGYDGNSAAILAMERGEVQGKMVLVNTINTTATPEGVLYKDGKVKVLLQFGLKRHPAFADVPNIFDFKPTDPDGVAVAKFILAPLDAGRPFAIPAGVPEDRVAALDAAFMAAVEDPAFIAEMDKLGAVVEVISGKEVEDMIADLYAQPGPVLDKVRKLLTPPQ